MRMGAMTVERPVSEGLSRNQSSASGTSRVVPATISTSVEEERSAIGERRTGKAGFLAGDRPTRPSS
jgi:hypothetical protein